MDTNEFEGAFKKKAPVRAPRRRRPVDDEEGGDTEEPTPDRGAKKSGWGDTPADDGEGGGPAAPQGRRRNRAADDDDDDEIAARKHDSMTSHNKHDIAEIGDEDDTTAVRNGIRDLEDEQEDMARQVAEAPHLTKSRVQSIKELDEQIDMALPSASEIGIDLSVLQNFLYPQETVAASQEDEMWDFSAELQKLASEMQREAEAGSGDEPVVKPVPTSKPSQRARKPLAPQDIS